jgi:hypothetical protein
VTIEYKYKKVRNIITNFVRAKIAISLQVSHYVPTHLLKSDLVDTNPQPRDIIKAHTGHK